MRDKDQRWQVFVKILKWRIFGKKSQIPKNILNKVYNRTLSFNEFIEYQLYKEIPISCIIESERQIVKNIPYATLNKIYNCTLSFNELIDYQLEDKIPISCLIESDRKIVEKFGIDKCKELDWELINKKIYDNNINFRDILMSIDTQTEDINRALYELVKDQIRPSDYSPKMAEIYSDRIFAISQKETDDSEMNYLKNQFNKGQIDLNTIIYYWDLFKNKDLSYCLLNDENNKNNMTDAMLKEFMTKYSKLASLIIKYNNIYSFINTIYTVSTEKEKQEFIKQITDEILRNTYREHGDSRPPIELTDEQYQEIFKYSSLEDYLKVFNEYRTKPIIDELKTLPQNYVFNMPIPFSVLLNSSVLNFIGIYGLKNIVDFDNECGHFFTKNNCEMLKLMYGMYTEYSLSPVIFPDETFLTKNIIDKDLDENDYRSDRPYTKDEFYEAMRRMIIYGPTNSPSTVPDYRDIVGEFRDKNPELFISEQAPEELQKLFYTKSLSLPILLEHPEYIQYLNGKDFSSCFKGISVRVKGSNASHEWENIYKFLSSKADFNGRMNFFIEQIDILLYIFNSDLSDGLEFSIDDDIDQIKNILYEMFKKIMIIEKPPYPVHIPKDFIEKNPSMFLDKNAPQELQEAFYSRTITSEFILSNPEYKKFLDGVDLEILFKYMPVRLKRNTEQQINFVTALKQIFGEKDALDVMLIYDKYVAQVYEANQLRNFLYTPRFTQDEFLNELDNTIFWNIVNGKMKYDENIPSHFKKNYPTLFLDVNVPQEIKDKFYNREFTLKDFNDNPKLLDIFENTNIACAFPENMSWIIPLFNDSKNFKAANYKRMKVVSAYSKLLPLDDRLKFLFREYIYKFGNNLDAEKIEDVSEILLRLEYSNSIELSSFKERIACQLLITENPMKKLEELEAVFIRNNLPLCGKMFLCFKVLYPDLSRQFDFSSTSRMAPELKDDTIPNVGHNLTNDEKRLILIFNDLLRTSYRSNERSLVAYLENIEEGNKIYLKLQNNNFNISKLTDKEREVIEIFVSHLEVLYKNTNKGKEKEIRIEELPLEEKLKILSQEFKETEKYTLKDRIVRSFCYFAGIKTFDELKKLLNDSYLEQKERIDKNLSEIGDGVFKIEAGDFVRCIGGLDELSSSFPCNVCREYLGTFLGKSTSDTTPLDIDFSLITTTDNLFAAIQNSPTGFGFGNIFLIVKKDNPNFYITRDKDGKLTDAKYDSKKVELFGTKTEKGGYETHWGARTGISLADVDYILFKDRREINREEPYDKNGNVNYLSSSSSSSEIASIDELTAVKFEIARNGYYIPVIDFSGKLIFTKEEFKQLRNKMMQGLKYYKENHYEISDELITPEIEEIASSLTENAIESTNNKRNQINAMVKEVLDEMGLSLKYQIDGDLSPKSVEFIDTGSTGRNTNIPYDGDFDFFMRLDATIMRDFTALQQFKTKLENKFRSQKIEDLFYTSNGDLRIKGVHLNGNIVVDVDISFGVKTNKVKYSADECLRDRLSTIKELYPNQYKYVVANIIKAKKFLKDINAYNPKTKDPKQGGLGGVGVETWILQNGGSFITACRSFIDAAINKETGEMIPYKDFKKKYQIWDCGENHFTARRERSAINTGDMLYLYDNLAETVMNEIGYEKMVKALKEYLRTMETEPVQAEGIKR